MIDAKIKSEVLAAAKSKLSSKPYDLYHTQKHHDDVFQLCLEIVKDNNVDVDLDVLEIACLWHDVYKGSGDNEIMLLETALRNLRLPEDLAKRIVSVIAEHSFGKDQTTNESRVLYDADKIDLVSTSRWKDVFEAFERGEVTLEERDRYIKEWNRRMPLLEKKLHYATSNEIFSSHLKEFKLWLTSIGKLDDRGDFISEIE